MLHHASSYVSPPTTPVQEYIHGVNAPPPPKIWSGIPFQPPSSTAADPQDHPLDDQKKHKPDTWYDVCSLYCTDCKYFQFAGNYENTPIQPSSVATSIFETIPTQIPNLCVRETTSAFSAVPPTTTTTPTPHTPHTPPPTNCATTPSSSPVRKVRRSHQHVPRRTFNGLGPPSLCCLPVSSSSNHLRCVETPVTTRSLRSQGCQRCASHRIQVLRVRVQWAEMQYGSESMSNLPNEIAHALLVCDTCHAIGFPGCSDRLTVIHEDEDEDYSSASNPPAVELFYDTVSQRSLNATAWTSAFAHVDGCHKNKDEHEHEHGHEEGKHTPQEQGNILSLPIRLRKSDLAAAFHALQYTTPLYQRPMALLAAKKKTNDCRLQFSNILNQLVEAVTLKQVHASVVHLTNHILSMRELPSSIFQCSTFEMRVRVCNTMRKKRNASPNCWNREVASKFGVLLRVFNMIEEEERTRSEGAP